MLKWSKLLLPFCFLYIISGCSEADLQGAQMDYEETKKMVVDILKTDDGKKAIQEVMSDEKLKQQLVMDQVVVKDTIEQTLTSDKGMEFWKKAYSDPKFAEGVAKSMQKENATLMKNLMNDPDYRSKMVELMKDPELQKEVQDTLKSTEYRAYMEKVVSETFENPLFKAKIEDLLMKAAAETKTGKKEEATGA
ncbi:spore germination lipoprotein GerD [Neobacillus sp. LXY-4]|uniref:spore germination lipoprotein GerD n=1 Tax=Neobacillus sp. LXY-4 TaxID=3379826 RepID=UPI003EE16FF5